MKKTYRDLSPVELNALQIFAKKHGRKWRDELSMVYWYNARPFRDKSGNLHPELHRLRNDLGPTWLYSFKMPVAA